MTNAFGNVLRLATLSCDSVSETVATNRCCLSVHPLTLSINLSLSPTAGFRRPLDRSTGWPMAVVISRGSSRNRETARQTDRPRPTEEIYVSCGRTDGRQCKHVRNTDTFFRRETTTKSDLKAPTKWKHCRSLQQSSICDWWLPRKTTSMHLGGRWRWSCRERESSDGLYG